MEISHLDVPFDSSEEAVVIGGFHNCITQNPRGSMLQELRERVEELPRILPKTSEAFREHLPFLLEKLRKAIEWERYQMLSCLPEFRDEAKQAMDILQEFHDVVEQTERQIREQAVLDNLGSGI